MTTPFEAAKHAPRARRRSTVDGRTTAAKRLRRLQANIDAEVGSRMPEGEARRQLVRRTAAITIFIEDLEARSVSGEPVDQGQYLTAVSTHLSLLGALGIAGAAS